MKKNYFRKINILFWVLPLLLVFVPLSMTGQTTDNYSPGDTSWTVAPGVFSVDVEVWGAGGGGGGSDSNKDGGSGGGGGGYSMQTIAVSPGDVLNFTVGTGGLAGASGAGSGFPGGDSTFTFGAYSLVGSGGTGGAGDEGAAGTGGAASGGGTNTSGSDGTVGGNSGGAGGAAAGPGGGAGGGAVSNSAGVTGSVPGGGGSGGERSGGTNMSGGAGGDGRVAITYTVVAPAFTVSGDGTTIPDLDVTPDTVDFTDFSTFNTRQFDLINATGSAITVNSIALSGANAADFSITNFTPGTVVGASDSDLFEVLFSPSVACANATARDATITVNYNDGAAKTYTYDIQATCYTATKAVTGNSSAVANGAGTGAATTANNTDYGNVPMNFVDTNTFVVTNTGTNPLSITSIAASGGAEFSVTAGSGATTILGNSSSSFSVSYDPNAIASDNATITVTSNLGTYTFAVIGAGIADVLVPGCLGDPGDCTNTNSSSFDSSFTGWTNSGGSPWVADIEDGFNTAYFNQKTGDSGAGLHASMLQNITGLDAGSSTLLVKFKVKVQVQSCNQTGRFFDLNVKFGGTTYLNFNLVDTDLDAQLNLLNGGLLVATDLTEIRTHFTPGGCSAANRPDQFATIYLSIPKGAATSGNLEVTMEDTGVSGTSQMHQMHVWMAEIEATSNGGACGFMWLKADSVSGADASEVTTWSDSANGGNDATGTAGSVPTLQFNSASNFNFNPSLSFDGSSEFLKGDSGYSSASQFVVFKHSGLSSASSSMTLFGSRVTDDNADRSGVRVGNISALHANEVYGIQRGTEAAGFVVKGGAAGLTYLNGILYSTVRDNGGATPVSWDITRNGSEEARAEAGTGYQNWVEAPYTIGASTNIDDYSTMTAHFDGQIAEVLSYPAVLSTTEVQKIQTYLAVKYGITLNHDYLSGAGTTIYDVSSHGNRIFGIGYEACQGIHQRQSQSQDDADTAEILLTIGYNSTISGTNASGNGQDMNDGAFVVIGDDNGSRGSWTVTDAPTTEIVEATRIGRVFKLQKTGTVDAAIRFQLDGTKLPAPALTADERVAMVIADNIADIPNATFNDSTDKIIGMTLSGTDWITDVDVSGYSTAYFTFIKYQDCYTDLICSGVTTTWDGASWSPSTPTVNDTVIINGDYDTGDDGDFTSCVLTINNTFTLTIDDGGLVEVQSNVVNNGLITVENNGSLMQYYDGATNTGDVKVVRDSQPMYRADYTYWSSPVSGFDIATGIASSGLRYYYDTANTTWAAAAGTMDQGKGYIVMTDNPHETNAAVTTVEFEGASNTGRLNVPISVAGNKWNLVGNPYPSALDAQEFITENHTNRGVTTGGLYFWTHNTRISGYNSGDTSGSFNETDYAVYTYAGGIGTGTAPGSSGTPVDDSDGANLSGGGNTASPTGYIAAGQSFFVLGAGAGGNATFKNCMRYESAGGNSNFYKSVEPKNQEDKFWLSVENKGGSYKEMLLGYFDGAMDGYDGLYDAEIRNGTNMVQIYSFVKGFDEEGQEKTLNLSIEGRNSSSLTSDEVIPIGYKRTEDANVESRIALKKVEGQFVDKNIYLEDRSTQTLHDLKSGPYVFEENGEVADERFAIRYTDQYDDVFTTTIEGVHVLRNNNTISVVSEQGNLNKIDVYNELGQLVLSKQSVGSVFYGTDGIPSSNALLVVVVELENGSQATIKIIH